jgi:hypothetical protein
MDTSNYISLEVPADYGFRGAIRMSSKGEPGNTVPNDDWGVYADLTGNLAGFGYDLIVRGTLAEVKRQVRQWVNSPDTYWQFAFHYRQDKIAQHRRDRAQPYIPEVYRPLVPA